eukprot:356979-Chlamydomonas_euryale.AAC.5
MYPSKSSSASEQASEAERSSLSANASCAHRIQELRSEFRSELRSEFRSELRSQFRSELRSQFRSELMSEFRSELRNELRSGLRRSGCWELRSEREHCTSANLQWGAV